MPKYQKKKEIRIALFLHELSRSGAPRVALDIFKNLSDEFDIRVFSLHEGPLSGEATKVGLTKALEKYPLPLAWCPEGAAFRINGKLCAVLQHFNHWKPDLLYFNSIVALNWFRYTKMKQAPVILHVHEADSAIDLYSINLQKELYRIPDHYITVSQSVKNDLINRNIKKDKVSIVYPYIDMELTEKYANKRLSKKMSAKCDTFAIGGSGGVSWTKGIQLWLLMAKYLTEMVDKKLQFVWVGADENNNPNQEIIHFRVMAKKLGISDVVKIVPPTPFPLEEFIKFDIFALTSWEESASLVLMENMALGVPTICFSNSGGPREFIFSPHVAVDGFSPYHMAQQINFMLGDLNVVRDKCTQERGRVYEICNRDKSIMKIREILKSFDIESDVTAK